LLFNITQSLEALLNEFRLRFKVLDSFMEDGIVHLLVNNGLRSSQDLLKYMPIHIRRDRQTKEVQDSRGDIDEKGSEVRHRRLQTVAFEEDHSVMAMHTFRSWLRKGIGDPR
jgi:hypothetical protein